MNELAHIHRERLIENRDRQPTVIIGVGKGLFEIDLESIWQYRELLFFLVWRDIKIRYKQTVIGTGWAVLQPVMTMVIFTVVFGNFAKVPSDGLPYPIFAYAGLLPWNYFAQAIGRSGGSLVGNSNLITKVYFPRLIIPISAVLTPLVEFTLAFGVLIGMLLWFGISLTWNLLFLPIFVALALMIALSLSLFVSAVNVKYRDILYAVPFFIQFWMYASPVAYPLSLVPEKWRFVYSLNPMVGIIEGFRWAILGKAAPDFGLMALNAVVIFGVLISGVICFKRMERTFVDVI